MKHCPIEFAKIKNTYVCIFIGVPKISKHWPVENIVSIAYIYVFLLNTLDEGFCGQNFDCGIGFVCSDAE